jgi:hypothetical protein
MLPPNQGCNASNIGMNLRRRFETSPALSISSMKAMKIDCTANDEVANLRHATT